MTVAQLIKELSLYNKDLEVQVVAPNGELFSPKIKFMRENAYDFNSKIIGIVLQY